MRSPREEVTGIRAPGQDDADGRPGHDRRDAAVRAGHRAQGAAGGREQDRAERDGQAGQHDLRLRVAEAGVALEQDRTVGREHESRIQRPDERRPAPAQLGEDRHVDLAQDRDEERLGQVGERRVGAHATGVRSVVAVAEALVVAGSRQGDHVPAVRDRDDARLASDQSLLDQDDLVRPGPEEPLEVRLDHRGVARDRGR